MSMASRQDYDAVLETLQKYLDGTNGNVDLLKQAFHENAIMNGRPIQVLYDIVTKRGATRSMSRVDYLDILGNAASARMIIEDWHGYNFVEYMHLVKEVGVWKITSKTGASFT